MKKAFLRLLLAGTLLGLVSCGGGGGGSSANAGPIIGGNQLSSSPPESVRGGTLRKPAGTAPQPTRGAGGAPGSHLAALGPLAGANVTVTPLSQPGLVIDRARTNSEGFFSIRIPKAGDRFDEEFLLVEVSGGRDIDADDDGIVDAKSTRNKGTLRLLVKGKTLKTLSVSASLLSDVFYRAVEGHLSSLPPEAISRALDQMAFTLLKGDIDGDGFVSYSDIAAFNPTRPEDKAKLRIDWAKVLEVQDRDGTSLVSKYHNGRYDRLPQGIADVFGGMVVARLPDQSELSTVDITISTGNGGVVTSPGLPGVTLGSGGRRHVHTMERNGGTLTLLATPDPLFKFSRWIGCPNPQGALCEVSPTDNLAISAQFLLKQNKLTSGLTKEVVLDAVPGRLGLSFQDNDTVVLVAAGSDAEAVSKIKSIQANTLLHTGMVQQPQVKITEVISRGNTKGGNFYRAKFRYTQIQLFNAYSQASFEEPDRPVTMDDLLAVSYRDETPDPNSTPGTTPDELKAVLPSRANQNYVEGPAPGGTVGGPGNCANPDDEQVFTTEVGRDGQPLKACIGAGAQPVPEVCDCNPGERLLETLDGRLYCVPNNTVVAAAKAEGRTQRVAMVLGKSTALNSAALTPTVARQYCGRGAVVASVPASADPSQVTHVPGTGPQPVVALLGKPVAPMQVLSQSMKKARAEGRLTPTHRARVVFLAGYGKAFDLGDGVYLTDNPKRPGLVMLQTEGQPQPVPAAQLAAAYQEVYCRKNAAAGACGGIHKALFFEPPPGPGGIRPPGRNLFPSPLEFEYKPEKYPALVAVVKFQLNVDLRTAGNATWLKPLRAEVNTAGALTLQPEIGVDLAYKRGLGNVFKKDGDRSEEEQKAGVGNFEKKLVSIDIAKGSTAIFSTKFELAVGADLLGEVKVETQLVFPLITRWDGQFAAGWGCREFYLFYNEGCESDTRFDFVVVPSAQYSLGLQASANAIVEPYVEARVTAGITGVAEDFGKIALRGFVQLEALLEGFALQFTNIPERVAAAGGKKFCVEGFDGDGGQLALNAYYGYRAYAEFSSSGTPLGEIFAFTSTLPIAEKKYLFYSAGWENRPDEGIKPLEDNVGFQNRDTSEDYPSCTGGIQGGDLEDEREFEPGRLELRDDAAVASKTRLLKMQKDGNLVMYDYDGERGRLGDAVFASDTSGTVNTRLLYQTDGNLVIYNLREQPIWASGTYNRPNSRLKIDADGELVMFSDSSESAYPIWGRALTQQAGKFELKSGEFIVTDRRLLYMQPDGNLVVYRYEPRAATYREARWASGTHGNPGAYLTFQPDGNLVVYSRDDRALWASGTNGRGETLHLQRDGNLVVYDAAGEASYATGSSGD